MSTASPRRSGCGCFLGTILALALLLGLYAYLSGSLPGVQPADLPLSLPVLLDPAYTPQVTLWVHDPNNLQPGQDPLQPGQATAIPVFTGVPLPAPSLTPLPTPTPTPVNGRIVFAGFDQGLWSIEPGGQNPQRLGQLSPLQVFANQDWIAPDGSFLLGTLPEGEGQVAALVRPDGSGEAIRLGTLDPSLAQSAPYDYFAFAPDSSRAFFVDSLADPPTLRIVDLPGGEQRQIELPAGRQGLTEAAFLQDGSQLLVRQTAPETSFDRLLRYDLSLEGVLPEPALLAELPAHRIQQFAVSPDGERAALILRPAQAPGGADALWLLDLTTFQAQPLLEGPALKLALLSPAWSPDSRYLLVNQWSGSEPVLYSLLAYDSRQGVFANLLADQPSAAPGQPLSAAAHFAPDDQAVAFTLYEDQPDALSFWIALLDGSYVKEMARAIQQDGLHSGAYVAALAPDWTFALWLQPDETGRTGTLSAAALDGSRPLELDQRVPLRAFNLVPILSPDGQQATYLRLDLASGLAELCTIGVNGKGQRVLLRGGQPGSEQASLTGIPLAWLVVVSR